jgi:uncharacterized protein YkwD
MIIGTVLALALLVASPAGATTSSENLSGYLLNYYDRAPAGLAALRVNQSLSTIARAHSYAMARKQILAHTPNLGSKVSGWTFLGENVGVGPSLRTLNVAFMRSTAHRQNIMCRCYRQIGVGVVRDSRGYYWVTHIFYA